MVNNRGERMVKAVAGAAPVSSAPVPVTTTQTAAPVHRPERSQPLASASESVAERSHKAEIERLQASHSGALAALQAQHRETLALMLERIDAAEIRAERVEQRIDQVLDTLLAECRPWWRRWLGGRG
jgi:hypothetical protein